MTDAYIVDGVRSAVGKRRGGLAGVHPADLAATVLAALLDRAPHADTDVDDVILGCVEKGGAQASNVARVAWLSAGLHPSVPGVVVDRRCGSGQQAIDFAADAVRAGRHHLVVAGGVESMSVVPMGSPALLGVEAGGRHPYDGEGWAAHVGGEPPSQFASAELIAERWGISRSDMEAFALRSHERAIAAIDAGWFSDEIVPVAGVTTDEGPRRDTTLKRMAAMDPLVEDGRITAALASQMSDAAAVLMIASDTALQRHGLTPRARIVDAVAVGADPELMLTGPIPATTKLLERNGLGIDDIDLFEVNEAFASVVLAWAADTSAPMERTNVNGGAIALGHPLGATGARLMLSMLHELERRSGRYGLQVMCEGGGTANATLIERL